MFLNSIDSAAAADLSTEKEIGKWLWFIRQPVEMGGEIMSVLGVGVWVVQTVLVLWPFTLQKCQICHFYSVQMLLLFIKYSALPQPHKGSVTQLPQSFCISFSYLDANMKL